MKTSADTPDSGINLSGLLVMILVLGLTTTMQESFVMQALMTALSAGVLTCYLVFILADSLTRALRLALFWLQTALILTLYVFAVNSFIAILGIVWIVQAETLFGVRRANWLLIASATIYFVALFLATEDLAGAAISAGLFALFQVFALTAAHRATRERRLREETAALNRELLATRQLLSQSVAQSERVRIARDLHDLLGHHMTALILNLEVATHAAMGQQDHNLKPKIDKALALAKLLLSDIRTAVSELREDEHIDLKAALSKMVADITAPRFELNFPESIRINDMQMAETLLRCAQEAITNILRHSAATNCKIGLAQRQGEFFLSIEDNGSKAVSIVPGNGLSGMRERVEAAGGEMSWHGDRDGFRIQVSLPAEAAK